MEKNYEQNNAWSGACRLRLGVLVGDDDSENVHDGCRGYESSVASIFTLLPWGWTDDCSGTNGLGGNLLPRCLAPKMGEMPFVGCFPGHINVHGGFADASHDYCHPAADH